MPLESPSGQSGEPTGGAFYNGAAIGPQVPPETVQAQLQRIVAHPIFSRAERSGRLLSFLVVKVLHGEAGELTQYLIATEVFKRGEAFDPEGDAIVRVEASRLRRRLQEYYDVAGQDDPVLIELLQRSYIPVFQARDLAGPNGVEKSTSRGTFGARHVTAVGLVALLIAG